MAVLSERLDMAEQKIKEPSFRQNTRLGNEVGYYIFDYPAEEELYVRERVEMIRKRYTKNSAGFEVGVFDLYEIMNSILERKGYMQKCYDMEKKRGFQKVSTAVANLMRVNSTESLIIDYIKEHVGGKQVIFVTGIGKCYPIIRSHTVLNNMQHVIDSVPVVMFYPGKYDGQELVLFGKIKDDNYYRAFKLVE